jgi:dihydroorotase
MNEPKNYLLKSVHILSDGSPFHNQVQDVLIANGKIQEIGKNLTISDKKTIEIQGKGQYLSAGFFDLNANYGEPGYETKEDLATGAAAAMAGGFTAVAVHPNTNPPLHRQSEIALIKNRAKELPVEIYPIGTISKHREGKELSEMYDMKQSGAVAFCDGDKNVSDAGLMGRALLYAKGINTLIISYPEDEKIAAGAPMNEGVSSTYLGMKGNPNLAEAVMVARDLYLAEYYDSKLHFTTISTAESVNLIRKAKAKGLQVTCDVAAHHLHLTDDLVSGFDSHYKVQPPLRTKVDVKELLKGIKDGTIDAVVSQHTPHEVEYKRVEFQIAKYGIITQQTVLPSLLKAGLSLEEIVEKLAVAPRKVLGMPVPQINKGEHANVVLFNPDLKWTFDGNSNQSKSANSPFFGQTLLGGVTFVSNKSISNIYHGSINQ